MALADVDGDGRLDLVVAATNDSAVSILLGNGAGSFAKFSQHALGTRPVHVTLGSLDGDGAPGLVVANPEEGHVSVLLERSVP